MSFLYLISFNICFFIKVVLVSRECKFSYESCCIDVIAENAYPRVLFYSDIGLCIGFEGS